MKATNVLLTTLCAALLLSACSKDDEPLQDAKNEAKVIVGTRADGNMNMNLSYRFNADGILIVDNAQIPSRATFDKEIDGHAWRLLSQGFVLADGSIKDNNKGNRDECIILLQERRIAIMSISNFAPKDPSTTYGNTKDYDDQTGSIGFFNVMKLSTDGSQMITVAETWWYPDPAGKCEHGYSVEVYERLTDVEKNQAISTYKVDMNQMVGASLFEASKGKKLFGAKMSELSFSYIYPGQLRVNGMKQISESVFRKYIAGYGWKCEIEHQIETNGTVNSKEYEYIEGLEKKVHYFFGDNTYQVFSTSYYHNNTPWFYEEKYVYDESINTFFEINDGQRVGGEQIICLDDDKKSFYMIRQNMQNHYSSNSNDFRYNLVKYTRLSDQELKDLREKHSTNFWDLDWETSSAN